MGLEKYDEKAAAMIAQLKYGSGTPFYRLEQLEKHLGIPLPAATQWEIVEETAQIIKPARDELLRQAAQGEIQHNATILVLAVGAQTGVIASGIISIVQGRFHAPLPKYHAAVAQQWELLQEEERSIGATRVNPGRGGVE